MKKVILGLCLVGALFVSVIDIDLTVGMNEVQAQTVTKYGNDYKRLKVRTYIASGAQIAIGTFLRFKGDYTSAPSGTYEAGDMIFNSTDKLHCSYDGTSWERISDYTTYCW